MKHLEFSTEKKQTTIQKGKDRITIRYIPLPPEKRAAWEQSMRILTEMMLEILEEQETEIIESIFERNET